MRKVLIPTKLDKFAATMLSDRGYQVVLDAATPLDELVKANSDAEVLIVRSEKITPEIIDLLPNLKLIVRAGAGYNTIDIKYARKRGVDVMNTPGANANAVAEEVVAMILAAAFRSYLLYFLGVASYTLHQFLNLLFRSLREGSYSGYELFDTVVEYILLVLAGCLLWQLILFTFGHADIVALTHTSMLFVTLTLLLTFLPFMIRVFRVDLYVTDAYHVVCLGLSYLSFCTGMEKSAPASGPAAQGTYADPGTTDPTGSAPGASAPVPRPQKDIPPASGEGSPADPGCHTEE